MFYGEIEGSASVFRAPDGFANGNTVDLQGRLITCEHLYRRVTGTEFDGQVTVLADQYVGKRLNSRNDAVVKSDGSIWFTDPDYGIIADRGGPEEASGPRHIRRLTVTVDGTALGASEVFVNCSAGVFDGFRIDRDNRLWASCAEGVHCFRRDGELIGKIHVPEMVSNLTFGGLRRNRLLICGTTSLYSIYLKING